MSAISTARARLGQAAMRGLDTTPARVALAEAKLLDYVRRVVDAAPPLSPEIEAKVVAILRGSRADEGGS
jgi:hypothetical protein